VRKHAVVVNAAAQDEIAHDIGSRAIPRGHAGDVDARAELENPQVEVTQLEEVGLAGVLRVTNEPADFGRVFDFVDERRTRAVGESAVPLDHEIPDGARA
jgi:hypothetical protein